jgi:cysteine sulfinate desulfinase/cysteine desulfurase-like protein
MSDELIAGSLRISLGRLSTEENVKKATALLVEAVQAERVRVGR